MPEIVFKVVYVAGIIAQVVIRAPIDRQRRQNSIVTNRASRQEMALLSVLFFGMLVLPGLYILTPLLSFADYTLPDWAGWLGVLTLAGALFVFWRSHVDLGRNWSPTLEIRAGHSLVTNGLYGSIRHPMYASQWLFVVAQPLLLHNWIAGVVGALCFLPLYFIRVPQEEQMMIEQFGEEYRAYMRRTGRVLPRFQR